MDSPDPHVKAERRADERYKVTCRVEVMRWDAPPVEAVVSDLSAGGCFVECGEMVSESELVKLRFRVNNVGDLTV